MLTAPTLNIPTPPGAVSVPIAAPAPVVIPPEQWDTCHHGNDPRRCDTCDE